MNYDLIHPGLHVTTHPGRGFPLPVEPDFLIARKGGAHGVVVKAVKEDDQGHCWWVKHLEDDSLAPYTFFELEEDPKPPEPERFSLL